jgi:hypothetical protein
MPVGYRKTVQRRYIGIVRTGMERGSDEEMSGRAESCPFLSLNVTLQELT